MMITPVLAEDRTIVYYAHQLDRLATELRHEADAHFRHTSGYRHLVNDANKLIRTAHHIDELAHAGSRVSYSHFEDDLDDLDDQVHHLHEVVDDLASGRSGHVHGSTAHVHSLMKSLENTVHALQNYLEDRYRWRDRHSSHGHYDDYHGHDSHNHGSSRRPPSAERFLFEILREQSRHRH